MNSTKTKPAKSKLNVRLLRRIQKHILAEPRRLYMSSFVKQGDPGELFEGDNHTTQQFPECGTAACIAGWACLLSKSKATNSAMAWEGMNLLGLTDAVPVFCVDSWPVPFRAQYNEAETPSERAKIAADRIEHLITTGE